MELTGRSYIFMAATLILLAGSLKLYQQEVDNRGLTLFGASIKACQDRSVRTENIKFGCSNDLDNGGFGYARMVAGGAKMVSVGG